MTPTWLLTADIHLSDKPSDDYRFKLFDWLAEQQQKHNVDATFILGDLTQEKDKHPATLVNRIIESLAKLKPPIDILRGNHDGFNPNSPYFAFLNYFDGIHFVEKPILDTSAQFRYWNYLLIPHCRTQKELELACEHALKGYPIQDYPTAVMLHQTFDGAESETGTRLSGLRASPIEKLKAAWVWSGDVHRPQTHGCVTYVGAPYTVRFGDNFTPRVILFKDNEQHDLHFPAPKKWALKISSSRDVHKFDLKPNDQVKISVTLPQEEAVSWLKHKQEILSVCKELQVEVHGLEVAVNSTNLPKVSTEHSDVDLIRAYCKSEKAAPVVEQAGLTIAGIENEKRNTVDQKR